MLPLIPLALFLPLVSFLGIASASFFISRKAAGVIASTSIFLSFLCFVGAFYLFGGAPVTLRLYNWIPVEGIDAHFTLLVDQLSLLMALIVSGVGFLIHVYSIGYMDHEEDYARYFACLNFFVFSMLLLVLAGHLLVFFVGWEGVGLASYLLIGFWYTRPAAAAAATKAFVVNRIGDLGLLLGLLLTFQVFGTGDISEVTRRASQFSMGAPVITAITLLYFWGATGKSAQLPLHTWLPDAMEGPTPVSALIHAATMVTAGVYLVVRMHPLFLAAPFTLQVVGYVGALTALYAALSAVGQTDLKRVLAYSTVSQLGLMFLACGVGAFYAAMFHLTTHAFVKALLFLSAGNVVHMMHGTTEMEKMGGLSKVFVKTHWLFLIGVLAMAGIPPLAAFFSKDLILEQGHLAGFHVLYYIGLLVSVLTAFYLMRAYLLTFEGNANRHRDIQEAPRIMLSPVSVLALLSIIGGLLGFCLFCDTTPLERFLEPVGITLAERIPMNLSFFRLPGTWISIIAALIGLMGAYYMSILHAKRLKNPQTVLKKAFYVDNIYNSMITRPLERLSEWIVNVLEPKGFDRYITGAIDGAQGFSKRLQKAQSGEIRSYIAWMVAGSALLLAYLSL